MSSKWIRGFVLIVVFSLMVGVQAQETPPNRPMPAPITTQTNAGIILERFFDTLQQGQVGLLRLQGETIQDARVLFRNHEYPFNAYVDGSFFALVVVDIDSQPRDYPLAVIVRTTDQTTVTFDLLATVESSGYVRQNFEVSPNIGYLIDPQIERGEYSRIEAITDNLRPDILWSVDGWRLPMDAPFTSAFGQYRILNQTVQTRHTGWDQSAAVGTPVMAMASGEVVFAGRLDIRGNYVIIDHGWGIFTGYAHLSQMNVERGQTVAVGQIIGNSGNTGRSSGPHLHWEIAVNGEWVDGALFLEMWLPQGN